MTAPRARSMGHLALVALIVLAAGCAAHRRSPALDLQRLQIRRLEHSGARIEVWLEVANSSPRELHIESLEYRLELDGHDVGAGAFSAPVTVAGYGRLAAASTVHVPPQIGESEFSAVFARRDVEAVMSGSYELGREGTTRIVPFRVAGRVLLER